LHHECFDDPDFRKSAPLKNGMSTVQNRHNSGWWGCIPHPLDPPLAMSAKGAFAIRLRYLTV